MSNTQDTNAARLDAIYAKIALIAASINAPHQQGLARMKFSVSSDKDDHTFPHNVISFMEASARRRKSPF
jgi:hypothetical protein